MADELLVLDNNDVAAVFDLGACMAALVRAYRAMAGGRSVERARSQTRVPLDEPDVSYCFKSMEGALFGDGYMTLRITSDAVFEGKVDGSARRDKLARGPGGASIDLGRLVTIVQPVVRARYELQELGRPNLPDALAGILDRITPVR